MYVFFCPRSPAHYFSIIFRNYRGGVWFRPGKKWHGHFTLVSCTVQWFRCNSSSGTASLCQLSVLVFVSPPVDSLLFVYMSTCAVNITHIYVIVLTPVYVHCINMCTPLPIISSMLCFSLAPSIFKLLSLKLKISFLISCGTFLKLRVLGWQSF